MQDKLIAVLGLLFTIAACIATWLAIPQVQKFLDGNNTVIMPTVTRQPQEQVLKIPTYTPLPTYTPFPTNTAIPTPTEQPRPTSTKAIPTVRQTQAPPPATVDTRLKDTPPGSVLRKGQSWTTNGFSIQFENMDFTNSMSTLYFNFINNTGVPLLFYLNKSEHIRLYRK